MPAALERAIPSDVQYIEGIVAEIVAQCAAVGFPPRRVRLEIPVAITEAIANAICYGNANDVAKLVLVRARIDAHALIVEVADEGQGFDLALALRDPTTDDRRAGEDGRGLFLMHAYVDRVEQFRDGAAGRNVVRLTVHRA
jgi:anti-sigma regulatory factor (Ser/Thr protein kinase)